VILTSEEVGLLKQLKAAGQHGRTISARGSRARLNRLIRAGYIEDYAPSLDPTHYRITKRGEIALADVMRFA
jgi:hypothetical protein